MAADILLYWGSGSPPCWRVMLCLEEKGLQGYQSKLISFDKKEHKSEEILKINPRGQVGVAYPKTGSIFFLIKEVEKKEAKKPNPRAARPIRCMPVMPPPLGVFPPPE